MKVVTALGLRRKLGSVLDGIVQEREPVTITRANKPLVVIMSADDYEEKMAQSRHGKKLMVLSARMEAWKKEHREETASLDATKAIRESRNRR